jgi:aspartyl-tRNA(Asn)/glutamyl-tRNA(Gln) amidotransferase subunit A
MREGYGVAAALDAIAGAGRLNALLAVVGEGEAARQGAEGEGTRALTGVPVAVKDNICTLGLPTTCGSRMLEGYVSPYEATAVRRLRAAGAVIVGKTNLDEFAMGSSTEHSAFGPTLNPHDAGRVPGGSSGGSAAAVAARLVPVALGSETGGSVRQPASFCGVVGLKPTYGRVSRWGLTAFAASLDCIGVLAARVADAARTLQCMAGADPRDATCADRPVPDLDAAAAAGAGPAPLAGVIVGVPAEYFPADLDEGVAAACARALDALRDAGAEMRTVSLPHTPFALPAYTVIAAAEASLDLARYDGVRYGRRVSAGDVHAMVAATRGAGFGAEVRRRIITGTFVLSAGHRAAYHGRATRARRRVARDFQDVFEGGVQLLLTPTTPTPAFRVGERLGDPVAMYGSDVFTVAANLAGLPAVSLPAGTVDGLPVGVQLIAPAWQEALLLRAAAALEARGA